MIELFWIVTQIQLHKKHLSSNTPLKIGLKSSLWTTTITPPNLTSTAGRLQILHFNTYELWLLHSCPSRWCTRASPILFCCVILSHTMTLQHTYKRPLAKGQRCAQRAGVPHLGVQGRSSSSSCWVREGCMREAWSQLGGVQRVRSPGIRGCWDQCCPCQIIWGSTGKLQRQAATLKAVHAHFWQVIVSKRLVTNH